MTMSLKLSLKIVEVSFVSRRVWLSIAAWRTIRSALSGWSFTRAGTIGFRSTNPLFGCAASLYLGGSK